MNSKCPTRLLSDLPASKDAFGPHERIAEAIADLIVNEDGGKSIALTGHWGSGKSTVVSLLKEQANNKDPKCGVFVFDAWSHEGDPLRRSFLERLIDFLCKEGWVDPTKWRREKEKLSKRLKITETSEVPRLTPGGIALTIATLLVPVGLVLISQFEDVPWWVPWLGCLFAAAPLLVFLFLLVTGKGAEQSETPESAKSNDKRKNILRLLVSQAETYTRNETIETPEPTSVEFQQVFDRAISDALSDDQNGRLLIVIDNLDRVDPQNALAIWSTMRTFFDGDSPLSSSCRSRFWLLVPFDPSSLTRLWPAMKEDKDEDDVATDFLEAFTKKTFQIQFRVSAPVLSDWKQFFTSQMKEALPQHTSADEVDTIYRLYRSEGIPKGRPITPRDIKVFLNDLGSLHRQWCDLVPLAFQALYVLCRERLEKDPESFVKEGFLSTLVLDLLPNDGDWRTYLASLHFNVHPQKAMEVVLRPVLDRTLPKGESNELVKHTDAPGLSIHIDRYLEENYNDWAEKEPEALARAAIVMDRISKDQGELESAWRWLSLGAKRVSRWRGLNEQLAEGISLIVKHARDEHQRMDLADVIVPGIYADPGMKENLKDKKQPEPAIVRAWVEGAMVLFRAFADCGCQTAIEKLRVPGSAETYLAAVDHMAKKGDANEFVHFFRPEVDPEQVISELSRICEQGKFTRAYSTVIETMLKIEQEWQWDGLVSVLSRRIADSTPNTLQPDELNGYLGSLLVLKYQGNVSQAQEVLQTLCREGYLFHQLYDVQNEPNLVAQVVFAYLDNLPGGNIENAPGNASAGKQFYEDLMSQPTNYTEIVDHLSAICMQFAKAHVLVNAFKQANQTEALASEVLRHTVRKDRVGHFLSSEYLLEEYETISQLLDDESLDRLIKALVKHGDLIPRLRDIEFSPVYEKLYALAYTVSDTQRRLVLNGLLIPALQAFTKDQWLEQLQQEGDFLQLLISMIEYEAQIRLFGGFHDALLGYAHRTVNGELTPTRFAKTWSVLPKVLDENWQKTLASHLWDMFGEGKDRSLTNLLKLYGDFLLDSQVTDAICDRVVRYWLPGMVDRGEVEELQWGAVFLEKKPELLDLAPDHSRNTFKDRILDKLQKCEDDALISVLERITRAMGISPEEIITEIGHANTQEDDKE